MLILCSNGLTSDALLKRVSSEVTGLKRSALVVTADNVYKEKNYHVERCIQELKSMDLTVDIFDLDHQPAQQLLDYDVVEFIGGNPYYLLHAIRTHHCEDVLFELSKNKILIGWSAAAFVFGPTLALADIYTPQMNFLNLTDLSGISLTSYHILPHYSKFLKKFDLFEETCSDYERDHSVDVMRLNDGDGMVLDESHCEIIRC